MVRRIYVHMCVSAVSEGFLEGQDQKRRSGAGKHPGSHKPASEEYGGFLATRLSVFVFCRTRGVYPTKTEARFSSS